MSPMVARISGRCCARHSFGALPGRRNDSREIRGFPGRRSPARAWVIMTAALSATRRPCSRKGPALRVQQHSTQSRSIEGQPIGRFGIFCRLPPAPEGCPPKPIGSNRIRWHMRPTLLNIICNQSRGWMQPSSKNRNPARPRRCFNSACERNSHNLRIEASSMSAPDRDRRGVQHRLPARRCGAVHPSCPAHIR